MKKRNAVSAFFILLAFVLSGQTVDVDSLKRGLQKNVQDEDKLTLLYNISKFYLSNNLDSCEQYIEKAISLSLAVNNQKALAQCFNIKGYLRAKQKQAAQAKNFHQKSLEIFQGLEDVEGMGQAYNALGTLNLGIGNHKDAEKYYREAFSIASKLKDTLAMAKMQMNLGIINQIYGDFEGAFKRHFDAAKAFESLGNQKHLALAYANIGSTYRAFSLNNKAKNEFGKAIEYQKKANDIYRQIGDTEGLIMGLGKLAGHNGLLATSDSVTYFDRIDTAKAYLEEALALARNNGFKKQEAFVISDLGNVYLVKRDSTMAKHYRNLSRTLLDSLDKSSLATEKFNTGVMLAKTEDYKQSIASFEKGLALAEEIGNRRMKESLLRELSIVFAKTEDFKNAYRIQKKRQFLRDSLINEEVSKAKEELEVKYQTAQREKLLAQKELEIEQERSKLRKWLAILAPLFVFLSVVLYFTYRNSRIRQKHNEELLSKNEQIHLLNTDIEHRTANHLTTMMALIESDIVDTEDNTIQSVLIDHQHRLQVVSSIHAQLQQKKGAKRILLDKYLSELCRYLEDFYAERHNNLQINLTVKKGLEIDALDATNLGLIVNELITNAVKYAFVDQESPRVDIKLQEDNGDLLLSVKDNGTGMASGEKRKGAKGLDLVNALAKRLHGALDIKNLDGLYCSARFKLKNYSYAAS